MKQIMANVLIASALTKGVNDSYLTLSSYTITRGRGKRREEEGRGGKRREEEGRGGKRREEEGRGGKRREEEGRESERKKKEYQNKAYIRYNSLYGISKL